MKKLSFETIARVLGVTLMLLAGQTFAEVQESKNIQQLPPDQFIKAFSDEILAEVKSRKEELLADQEKLDALIDEMVMPRINFAKTTQLVVGRQWRAATPEQREEVIKQFRVLLVKTYGNAISQVGEQKLKLDRLRARPEDTDVTVSGQVLVTDGPPIDLAFRLEKTDAGWVIYDLSVLGLWFVDSYRTQFKPILNDSGVEGLIKALKQKNGVS